MSLFKKKIKKVNFEARSNSFLPPYSPPHHIHTLQSNSDFPITLHLKVEDASIVFLEALPLGHHAVQQLGACGKGANGSQQPAVPWKDRQALPP